MLEANLHTSHLSYLVIIDFLPVETWDNTTCVNDVSKFHFPFLFTFLHTFWCTKRKSIRLMRCVSVSNTTLMILILLNVMSVSINDDIENRWDAKSCKDPFSCHQRELLKLHNIVKETFLHIHIFIQEFYAYLF